MTIPLDVMPAVHATDDASLIHIGVARRFLWSLRRELWENRWLYLAPASAALVFLLGFAVSTAGLPEQMRTIASLDVIRQRAGIVAPYDLAEALLMAAGLLISAVYCLDALYGERRDRSVLLWKSLPVSDLVTVLAKASIPIVIQPLITFVVIVATQLLMQVLSTAILVATGHGAAPIWTQFSLLSNAGALLSHLLAVHGLATAPFFGWLLMISAWAPRAPFMWAFVPPLVIGFVEKMAFNTTRFFQLLVSRLAGGPDTVQIPGNTLMEPMTQTTLANFLATGGFWIGLVITAAFLAVAVRLRRAGRPL